MKKPTPKFAQSGAESIPQNFIAKINREYNDQLQKGNHRPIDFGRSDGIQRRLIYIAAAVPILKYNGPPDEPDVDLEFGRLMAAGRDLRQAAGLFERRLQLLPGDVAAQLDLAKTFVDMGAADKAIDLIHKLPGDHPVQQLGCVPASRPWPTMPRTIILRLKPSCRPRSKADPRDENRLAILTDFYRVTGYAALREMNASTNAAVRTQKKKRSHSPL